MTHFILTKCLSRLIVYSITYGEQSIKMVMSLMFFFQQRIDVQVAKYFFKRLVTNIQSNSRKIVVDKLGSYRVAHRELMPTVSHDTSKYKNNRAELSHQPTRVRERGMLKFKSIMQANWFLS